MCYLLCRKSLEQKSFLGRTTFPLNKIRSTNLYSNKEFFAKVKWSNSNTGVKEISNCLRHKKFGLKFLFGNRTLVVKLEILINQNVI